MKDKLEIYNFRTLGCAILQKALYDYRRALKNKRYHIKYEVEKFIESYHYDLVCWNIPRRIARQMLEKNKRGRKKWGN